jgi:hypothetical protein
MITVFPERSMARFALVVFLPTAARDQLHAIGDHVCTGISNQKVNVVAGYDAIKYGETEAFFRFENPTQIALSVARTLQKKIFSMAAMCDVPDIAGQEVSIRSRHRISLEVTFPPQKKEPLSAEAMLFMTAYIVKSRSCRGPTPLPRRCAACGSR